MKKNLLLLLVMAISFYFSGCNSNIEPHDHTNPEGVRVFHTEYSREDGTKYVTEYYDDIKLRMTHYTIDDKEDYVEEYDNNGNVIKFTKYNSDGSVLFQNQAAVGNYLDIAIWAGTVQYIAEINIKNKSISIKYTKYNSDGSVRFSYINEYDNNCKKTKYTQYNSDDSIVIQYQAADSNYIYVSTQLDGSATINEYNSNDKSVKYTKYNSDGSIFLQNQAAAGNYITIGIIVYDLSVGWIFEYDNNEKIIKATKYNSDGSIFLQYQAAPGNDIISVWEYDVSEGFETSGDYISIRECGSNFDRITIYNQDGSIKKVINV